MTSIQPCALLLLVGPDWRIEAVSSNIGQLGMGNHDALIGQPLTAMLDGDSIHSLRNRMSWLRDENSITQDYGLGWGRDRVAFDVQARRHRNSYVIEAEITLETRLPDAIGMARSLMDRVVANDVREIATEGLRQLRGLSGFNRMILCDRKHSILATSERGPLPPLESENWPPEVSGKFPRLVADRDAEEIAILGKDNEDAIQQSPFLSPPDAERERLTGLAIGATMSLPLEIDGEQVGTIHGHHATSRRCGAERRAVASLFADRLAARMARQGWVP